MSDLIICERAETHPNGTFSIVKGGLDRWSTNSLPFLLNLFLFARISTDDLSIGVHDFSLDAKGARGQCNQPHGKLQVVPNTTHVVLTFPFQLAFEEYGTMTITLKIDGKIVGESPFSVNPPVQTGAKQ